MSGLHEWIAETISAPDALVAGNAGELIATKHYAKTPITTKDMVVVYRETSPRDGFIITAFLTSQVERVHTKGILWQRQSK